MTLLAAPPSCPPPRVGAPARVPAGSTLPAVGHGWCDRRGVTGPKTPPSETDRPDADPAAAARETKRAIEAVVRMEFARVVGVLARYTGDVGLAEELAQDALLAALEQWPSSGVPRNAGAWLTTVGKRRAVDRFRRDGTLTSRYAEIGRDLAASGQGIVPDFDAAFSDDIDDDILRLMFTACHPVLGVEARVALALRLLGGLTTAEIARAYLVPEATVAQRIVRAKRTIAREGVA